VPGQGDFTATVLTIGKKHIVSDAVSAGARAVLHTCRRDSQAKYLFICLIHLERYERNSDTWASRATAINLTHEQWHPAMSTNPEERHYK